MTACSTVHYKSKEGESTVRAGKVMFGTGRKPQHEGDRP